MLTIMLISMFDFGIYNIIYIYIYPIMVAHATITTIYIILIEVFCMHLLLCALYQN